MPMKRHLYPKNWDTIAFIIKSFADWKCEKCGRPCRRPGEDWEAFRSRLYKMRGEAWYLDTYDEIFDEEGNKTVQDRLRRFVLTTAHLDQNPGNNSRDNLKALCPTCHNRHDAKARAINRSHTRVIKLENAGQLRLKGL